LGDVFGGWVHGIAVVAREGMEVTAVVFVEMVEFSK
jgi:hypothetical protein